MPYSKMPKHRTVVEVARRVSVNRAEVPGNSHLLVSLADEIEKMVEQVANGHHFYEVYESSRRIAATAIRIMEEGHGCE